MKTEFFDHNIGLLDKKDPDLADRLRFAKSSDPYSVEASRAGPAALIRSIPGGGQKTLHSTYDPVREARRFVDSRNVGDALNYIVIGFGLGYHVLELVKRLPPTARVLVFEKNPALLRLALMNNDFTPILTHSGVVLHAGVEAAGLEHLLEKDRTSFALNGYVPVVFPPLIEAEPSYYSDIQAALGKIFQETKIDLRTQEAFSKAFYWNILENFQNILSSPGVLPLEHSLRDVPAIVVSAGPSLDKNIGMLKRAEKQTFLVATATALKTLLENGIEPDFVVAIDPDDHTVRALDVDPLPENLWLLYDPCVPEWVPGRFVNRRVVLDSHVYLSQWMARHLGRKGQLGKSFSVAHTAFLFAGHLGCSPIILVGQDLAFTDFRMHCRGSVYYDQRRDLIDSVLTGDVLERLNFQAYSSSQVRTMDIFGRATTTTPPLETYRNLFVEAISQTHRVFNATEGGVPIPGAGDRSLRDLLNSLCAEDVRKRKRDFEQRIQMTGRPVSLFAAVRAQARRLNQIHDTVSAMQQKWFPHLGETEQEKSDFVREMESLYKDLLKDPDTLQLIQGFAYEGFIQWHKGNYRVAQKSDRGLDSEVLNDRYQRDREFLNVLAGAAGFLGKAFERLGKDRLST